MKQPFLMSILFTPNACPETDTELPLLTSFLHYVVPCRIFTNSAAIATALKWLKQTQGGRRFSRSLVRF
jgi:hypothetical protein